MLTRLHLVDRWRATRRRLDLDEVHEPFDAGRRHPGVEPGGEGVRIAADVGPIEGDVEDPRSSRDGPGHDVAVRGVPVHLDGWRPCGPGVGALAQAAMVLVD